MNNPVEALIVDGQIIPITQIKEITVWEWENESELTLKDYSSTYSIKLFKARCAHKSFKVKEKEKNDE